MFDLDTFGHAGRTGGVHDVGEVVGIDRTTWIVVGEGVEFDTIGIEQPAARACCF